MNRLFAAAALATIALNASALPPGGMSDADMQKMMQGMNAMQDCMSKVDMAAMERLGEEGKKMEAEINALCKAGKRDAAQDKAMAFGMKIARDPDMQTMAECSKQMQGMMPPMAQSPYADLAEDGANRHVCDM